MIHDMYPLDVYVVTLMDAIVQLQRQAESRMIGGNFGNERIFRIGEPNLPFRVVEPSELAVSPYAQTALITADMIELSDIREINIPNKTVCVQINQHFTIADNEGSGHPFTSLSDSSNL